MSFTHTETRKPQSLTRSVSNTLKGSAGNLVEWYDVYVYSVFAASFEYHFFSDEDENSQLYIWAIFAVTFVMRPVGSWYFGRFADRHGRRAALTFSVSVMAACSFLIAIMPTRETIGFWAAVLLILLRLVQGFATGGEYGTSATYMSEAAVPGHRGFLASFQYFTLVGGHVLAQAVFLLMLLGSSSDSISSWGWRVAFGLGGVAALVVLWLRRTMDESLSDEALHAVKTGTAGASGSMRQLFSHYWRELLVCFLVTMGGTVAFYAYSVNGPNIIKATFNDAGSGGGQADPVTGAAVSLATLVVLMLLQPVGGWVADKVGRRFLLLFFGIGGVLYTWVLFTLLPTMTNPYLAFLVLAVGFIVLTGYTSINAIVKSELFPTQVRALGVGFGYAMANSIFGGTAPMLYEASQPDHLLWFIIYVTVLIGLSLLVYIFLLRHHGPNWLDDPETMRRRENSPDYKHFPMGV